MNIPNKKKFENCGRLNEKGKREKAKEEEREKELEEDEED
jgi:hypothetical protein